MFRPGTVWVAGASTTGICDNQQVKTTPPATKPSIFQRLHAYVQQRALVRGIREQDSTAVARALAAGAPTDGWEVKGEPHKMLNGHGGQSFQRWPCRGAIALAIEVDADHRIVRLLIEAEAKLPDELGDPLFWERVDFLERCDVRTSGIARPDHLRRSARFREWFSALAATRHLEQGTQAALAQRPRQRL